MKIILFLTLLSALTFGGCENKSANAQSEKIEGIAMDTAKFEKATFGSGCFWCTEAIFEELKGVHSVVSGYAGGNVINPTYEEVCTGKTGHAEVTQITYDLSLITYDQLLEVFRKTHDPTTFNRQRTRLPSYGKESRRAKAEDLPINSCMKRCASLQMY